MKRIITAVSILILITAVSFSIPFCLKKYTDELIYQLDYIEYTFDKKNVNDTQEQVEKFLELWEQDEEIIISFVNHGAVEDISYISARLSSLLGHKDSAEFLAEIRRIRAIISSIYEDEVPNLSNIL